MTSQSAWQTITIHILPNKNNQAVNFGQVIEYDQGNIFLQKLCRKWDRGTSSRSLFVTSFYDIKASDSQLSVNMFW